MDLWKNKGECMTGEYWFMLGMLTGVIVALGVMVVLI